ncbi:hypothetical protein BpHYR1_027475 [Brachionus plicatilis]|uniref:Uncharacterized protein n=1 Tax=Brachionus plicatilis TaxID=10195 RepID=A0A3M7SP66_BRAPC|nr:hypothetical protein BpHYR1_027475 [Brachionus plicatilis]
MAEGKGALVGVHRQNEQTFGLKRLRVVVVEGCPGLFGGVAVVCAVGGEIGRVQEVVAAKLASRVVQVDYVGAENIFY